MSTYFPLAGSNAAVFSGNSTVSGQQTFTGNVGIGTTTPDAAFAVAALNPVKVTQLVTNAEFPPAGASNAGAYTDYTDVVASIDAGTPMTLAEFPPVGLTSATTTAGPITIAVSGAFYGNGNYVVTASSVLATNYAPWYVFDKSTTASPDNAWASAGGTYSTTYPYAALSGGPTIVSGVSYTGSFLQIQLPVGIICKRYSLSHAGSGAPFVKWILAGSTDGTTWTLLDNQSTAQWEFTFYVENAFINFIINNNTTYTYYRIIALNIKSNGGIVSLREWKLFADIPLPTTAREYPPLPMTADTSYLNGTYGAGSYVASSSAILSGNNNYAAFNKVNSSLECWHSIAAYNLTTGAYTGNVNTYDINKNKYSGEWLQIKLSIPITLSSYYIYPIQTGTIAQSRNPTKFWILGSIDGILWSLVDSRESITWTEGVSQTFNIINSTSNYFYYRIVINITGNTSQSTSRDYTQISEWKLFGTQATYPKYRTAIPSTSTTYNAGTYTTYANTQYNATTVDAAPPLFVTDKMLAAPWRTGASNYTISADASPIPTVFFELPAQIRLASYRMTAPDTSEAPSAWNVYGSNMNVAGGWLLLDARTSIVAPWASSLTQTFSLPSPTSAFNFFKVDLLRNCASTAPGDFIALSELRLIGDDVTPESRIAVGADGRVAVNAPPSAVNASAAMTVGGNLAVNGSIRADNLGMFRNRIINGDMRVDQRFAGRSSNLVATAVGAYIADRWRVSNGTTTGALTVQRVRAPANPYGQVYALSAIATTAQATMNNQDYVTLEQRIEGYNIADFGWGGAYAQPVTVSFAAYSTQAGQYTLALRNATNTMSYIAPFTVPAANQWVQIQQTIAGETSGAWEVENGHGLSVAVTLAAGSNWMTSDVGRWQESSRAPSGFGYAAATGGVNFMGAVNNQFYLTGVQVEKGTIMTQFEARPLGVELQLCQRHYTKSYNIPIIPGSSTNTGLVFVLQATSGQFSTTVFFKTTMLDSPTVTIYDVVGNINKINTNAGANQPATVLYPGSTSFVIDGSGTALIFHYTANSEL